MRDSYTYRIHLEPEEEGGFTVTVPMLPGCVTWGRDVEHALAMAKEAIEGYLEVLAKHGMPFPAPEQAAPPWIFSSRSPTTPRYESPSVADSAEGGGGAQARRLR